MRVDQGSTISFYVSNARSDLHFDYTVARKIASLKKESLILFRLNTGFYFSSTGTIRNIALISVSREICGIVRVGAVR